MTKEDKWVAEKRTKRQCILEVFLAAGSTSRFTALAVCRIASLPGGTIYPHLAYLEGKGWICSGWQESNLPSGSPRRVYWLNPNPPTKESVP